MKTSTGTSCRSRKKTYKIRIAATVCAAGLLLTGCSGAAETAKSVELEKITVQLTLAEPTPEPQRVVLTVSEPTPSPTAPPSPTPEPTKAPSPEPTFTPEPTATPKPTAAPKTTKKPAATKKPKSTATPKPEKTAAPTARPTAAPEQIVIPADTPEPTQELIPDVPDTVTPDPAPEPTEAPAEEHPEYDGEYDYEALELAARVAYFETGTNDGYKAVLNVIYNRCLSTKFGGKKTSIRTEVYRSSQFTVVKGSKFESTTAPEKIIDYADDIFNHGKTVLPETVYFFRSSKSGTTWGDRVYYDTIGGNAFFYGSD